MDARCSLMCVGREDKAVLFNPTDELLSYLQLTGLKGFGAPTQY